MAGSDGTSTRKRTVYTYDLSVGPGIIATANSHLEFIPARHCRLVRMGLTISTAPTVTPPVITAKVRPVAGSATNQVTLSTLTIPITGLGSVAGDTNYQDVGDFQPASTTNLDGSTGNTSPASNLNNEVLPGQSIYFNVDTAASAGAGSFWFEIEDDSDLFKFDARVNKVASKIT